MRHRIKTKMAQLPVVPPLQFNELSTSCVNCGEQVQDLKCLPCLHSLSLCEKVECHEKIIHNGISCEICEEVFFLSPNDLCSHPFALRKAMSNQYQKEGVICQEEHEEERSATSFCLNCDVFICQECVDLHNSSRLLRKHQLKSLQEIFEQEGKRNVSFECAAHKKTCDHFCHTCHKVICQSCSIESHGSHQISYIDDKLGDLNKTTLKQCLSSAQTHRKAISSALQEVQDSKTSIQQESEDAEEEIAELKESLIAMINARCENLVAEVMEAEEKGKRELEKQENELKANLKKLEACHNISEEIRLEGTMEEQMSLSKSIVNRVSSLNSSISNPTVSIQPSIGFISSEIDVSCLGNVSHGAHPPNCTIEGLELKDSVITYRARPWAKKPALHFNVITRDESSSVCRGGKVLAVLHPMTAGVPVFGEVTDKGDGMYKVRFRSVPSENCKLSVRVRGHDIAGCPVEVKRVAASEIATVRKHLDVAVGPDGLLYCTDDKGQVTVLSSQGEARRSFKVKDAGLLNGIALNKSGDIIVSDHESGTITIYTAAGEFVRQFREKSKEGHLLSGPDGLAVSKEGLVFVVERWSHCVSVFTEEGSFLYSFDHKGDPDGNFYKPSKILIQGELVYVTDEGNDRIQVFQQDGTFIRQFGNGIVKSPTGIAATSDGHIVVASHSTHKLSIFTKSGRCVHEVTDIGLKGPRGVTVDQDGLIYVTDDEKNRIVVI